jgi:hypothetical protein
MYKVTTKVVSKVLGVTPRRVNQMVDEGKLSCELISNGTHNIRAFILDDIKKLTTIRNNKMKTLETKPKDKAA